MTLADPLREMIDLPEQEVCENERTQTPVQVFGVRLHSMGLSLREVVAVLDSLGIDRSHGAEGNWTHNLAETQSDLPTVEPSRVAVDDKQIEVDGEAKWLYAAIDIDSKCILDIDVYSRRGTDPAAAFLPQLTEVHGSTVLNFLSTAWAIGLILLGIISAVSSTTMTAITSRNGSKRWQCGLTALTRFGWEVQPTHRWLNRFEYHYNRQRPSQALDGQTPAEEVLN